ncbi:MAG: prepilin peptidase [Alphaproteobacteria bacterium GM7ARS4]|nr:prepilin peptidase [Alphaproteobacteria bacterium GM7ARS4]
MTGYDVSAVGINAVGGGVLLALSLAVLLVGAVADAAYRIVPNSCSYVFLFLWGVSFIFVPHAIPWWDIVMPLFYGGCVFMGGLVLYHLGGFGAGDVKWLSAMSVWAGEAYVVSLVMLTFLLGGVFVCFFVPYLWYRARRDGRPFIGFMRGYPFPFALPIACAGGLVAWMHYGRFFLP